MSNEEQNKRLEKQNSNDSFVEFDIAPNSAQQNDAHFSNEKPENELVTQKKDIMCVSFANLSELNVTKKLDVTDRSDAVHVHENVQPVTQRRSGFYSEVEKQVHLNGNQDNENIMENIEAEAEDHIILDAVLVDDTNIINEQTLQEPDTIIEDLQHSAQNNCSPIPNDQPLKEQTVDLNYDIEMNSILVDENGFDAVPLSLPQLTNLISNISEVHNDDFADKLTQSLNQNCKLDDLEARIDTMAAHLLANVHQLKQDVLPAIPRSQSHPTPQPTPAFTHSGIKTKHRTIYCDMCKATEFIGKRYKCLECWNYDICEECEASGKHKHLMVRLVEQQKPSAFLSLNSHNIVRGRIARRSDAEVKEKFVRAIVGPNYNEVLYKQLLEGYKDTSVEKFIMEMMRIFG